MKFETLKKRKVVSIDTETTGLRIYRDVPFGIALGWSSGEIWLPLDYRKKRMKRDFCSFAQIKDWLESPTRRTLLVFHNAKFDLHMLFNLGIEVRGPIADTMILAHCINEEEESIALKKLAVKYLDPGSADLEAEIRKLRVKSYEEIPPLLLEKYAKNDVRLTWDLYQLFVNQAPKAALSVYENEMEVMPVVLRMERRGHKIDKEYLRRVKKKLERATKRKLRDLVKEAGDPSFNPNSPKQVAAVVYKDQEPTKFTKTGQPSVDREALESVSGKFAENLRQYRLNMKMLNTYVDPLLSLEGDVVHCRFKQVGTVSGRFSSSDPNLQNIPRIKGGIRGAFIPREGFRLLYFDYSQIEMILFAWYSEDPNLLGPLTDGFDIHTETAQALFEKKKVSKEERKKAKTVNFGIIYGQGVAGLAEKTGWTMKEARAFLVRYYKRFPGVRSLMRDAKLVITRKGRIENAFGRQRHLKSDKAYKAVNALIQGCAADLLKRSMVKVDKLLRTKYRGRAFILLTIHDELVIETDLPDLQKLIKDVVNEMVTVEELPDCPIRVGVSVTSTNWLEKKDL